MTALLEVDALTVSIGRDRVVDHLSLTIPEGGLHALVGESGSGKSMTARALLGLTAEPIHVTGGALRFQGQPLASLASVRGRGVALIPQEPLSGLNPVLRVGDQLIEVLAVHHGLRGEAAKARAVALLAEVGLPDGATRLGAFPHELSGGMRQRVLIAAALACEPALLIADEPTTALDASVQGVVLDLLVRLARERHMALWLITHDLESVRRSCEHVWVMYAGTMVEHGPVADVLRAPKHPYTRALLDARPGAVPKGQLLQALEGTVPSISERIVGCKLRPRCPRASLACLETPALSGDSPWRVACFHPRERP